MWERNGSELAIYGNKNAASPHSQLTLIPVSSVYGIVWDNKIVRNCEIQPGFIDYNNVKFVTVNTSLKLIKFVFYTGSISVETF
jgi:hypothetical protein